MDPELQRRRQAMESLRNAREQFEAARTSFYHPATPVRQLNNPAPSARPGAGLFNL